MENKLLGKNTSEYIVELLLLEFVLSWVYCAEKNTVCLRCVQTNCINIFRYVRISTKALYKVQGVLNVHRFTFKTEFWLKHLVEIDVLQMPLNVYSYSFFYRHNILVLSAWYAYTGPPTLRNQTITETTVAPRIYQTSLFKKKTVPSSLQKKRKQTQKTTRWWFWFATFFLFTPGEMIQFD